MKFRAITAFAAIALCSAGAAAPVLAPPPAELGPDVQPFIHIAAGRIAITHLRIIDGTGAAPFEDATLLIDGAKFAAVLTAGTAVPSAHQILGGTGAPAPPVLVDLLNIVFSRQRPPPASPRLPKHPIFFPQMRF